MTFLKTEPLNDAHARDSIRDDMPTNATIPSGYDPGALKAWSRFRFVRAGWFSAQEAIEYIK